LILKLSFDRSGVEPLIFAFFWTVGMLLKNGFFDPFDRILALLIFYKSHHCLKISIISWKVSAQKILGSLNNKIDIKRFL